jgi:hypothetical protein
MERDTWLTRGYGDTDPARNNVWAYLQLFGPFKLVKNEIILSKTNQY